MKYDIKSIPWLTLFDAYGPAGAFPKFIQNLQSPDEDIWFDAVCEGLWSHLYHQYTIYSVTPYSIPFVAEILPKVVPECRPHIVQFLKACAEQDNQKYIPSPIFSIVRRIKGIPKQSIKSSILSCREILQRYVDCANDKMRDDVEWLLNYCESNQGMDLSMGDVKR